MPSDVELRMTIKDNLPAIREALDEGAKAFEEDYQKLVRQAKDTDATQAENYAAVQDLVRRYPKAHRVLHQVAGQLFPAPENTAQAGDAQDRAGSDTAIDDHMGSLTAEDTAEAAGDRAAMQGTTRSTTGPTKQRGTTMTKDTPRGTGPKQWTPELWMQLFKELVTALIGLTLIGYTVYMMNNVFGVVGDANRLPAAKDLLQLLLGFSGVVLGYYFGRVPADARAAQAQTVANTATANAAEAQQDKQRAETRSEMVSTRAAQINQQIEATLNATRNAGVQDPLLRSLRDQLRDLSDMARTH